MAKGILTAITSLLTSWNGYNKQRVEEFIKSRLSTLDTEKFGDIYINPQKKEDGYYHIECYASSADRDNPERVLRDIPIPILEMEEGVTYPISLSSEGARQPIVSIDGKVVVGVMFSSSRKEPGAQAVENTVTGLLKIYGRASSNTDWRLKDTRSITSDNSAYQPIDISACVPADTKDYQIRMLVDVNEETVKGSTQAVVWQSVTKTTLRLEYASDWAVPLTGNAYNPEYRAYGVVNKTLNLRITNQQGRQSDILTASMGDREYITQTFGGFSFADTQNFKMLSLHGVCSIESWLSVTGEPEKQSEHIYNQVMVRSNAADITPYLMIQDISTDQQLIAQNYVQSQMFRYAVYNPAGGDMPLEFRLTNYGGSVTHAVYPADNPISGRQYTFTNAVEIEDIIGSEIVAMLRAYTGSTPISASYPVSVDNTLNYSPKPGADFILNPRLRTNAETNPGRIINAANNTDIGATMTGFSFGDGIDGWTVDSDGVKCLRIPAGHHVSIPYDVLRAVRERGSAVSWSIELDFATRNVIDEDNPIISIANNTLTKGIILRALEGVVYTATKNQHDEQSFMWSEDTRTHIIINVLHNLAPGPVVGGRTLEMAVCRVFVNGIINREFSFDSDGTLEWYDTNQGQTIEIGNDNADIDIYNLRIYANSSAVQLSTTDCQQNFISTLPTVAEKNAARERNDITEGGKITLRKVLGKRLNAWVFRGQICSKADAASGGVTSEGTGDLKLWIHDDDGNLIPGSSGVINDTEHKNQGTTANSYAEHNQQDKFNKSSVFKPWADVNADVDNFTPTDDENLWRNGYQIAPGLPYAEKLVVKINWASSMQGHKQGATALYNDLYRQMCDDDKQMLVDQPNARVAVLERPVYMFREDPETGETTFLGLGTFGPGKMDKPTWGYDSDVYPEFCMLEGSDNNVILTDMRCPWDDNVVYDPKSEAFYRGGAKSIGFSTGKTDTIGGKKYPKPSVIAPAKEAWRFLYTCCPFIRHYDGTYAQLCADNSINTVYQYWLTQGEDRYKVYRYDVTETADDGSAASGNWVPAGLPNSDGNYTDVSIESHAEGLFDYGEITRKVILARVAEFKRLIDLGQYIYKNDLLFNRAFGKLFACSDNQSKNTYYCTVKSTAGDVKIALHADDLDTIMLTDNVGALTKPYHIEERDRKPDGVSYYWEGQYNTLYMLTDLAYSEPTVTFDIAGVEIQGQDSQGELRQTMNTMLTIMGNLVTKPGLTKDAKGCIEQYFFSQAQTYFCETAYNETARLRYESNQALYNNGYTGLAGSRGTQPLQQSTGDQLQAERQYIDRRLAYISSWCNYGVFGGRETTSGAWTFPVASSVDGSPVAIRFTLTPHQWLYASGRNGTTLVRSAVRMHPGQQYDFLLADNINNGSDTQFEICGADYYRSFGNLSAMPIGNPGGSLSVRGRRLIEFIARPENGITPEFRPGSIGFGGGLPMLKVLSLNGCTGIGGTLGCGGCGRLQSVDVRNTSVLSVSLPRTNTLQTVYLSAQTTSAEVNGQGGLTALTVQDYSHLTSFVMLGHYGIDSHQQAQMIFDAKPPLTEMRMENINWSSCRKTMLLWLAEHGAKMTGFIAMSKEDGNITFADKIKLGRAFGNIDTTDTVGGLKINYVSNEMPIDGLAIKCTGFMNTVGQSYIVEPGTKNPTYNDFRLRPDGEIDATVTLDDNASNYAHVEGGKYIRVDALQERDSATRFNLTVTIRKIDGSEVSASRVVAFYKRAPKLGDFAYVDGTFDDVYTEAIPLAGIVFDVRQDTSAEQETYIARVVSIVTGESDRTWGAYADYYSAERRQEINEAIGTDIFNIQELPDYNTDGVSDPRTYMNEGVLKTGAASDENGKQNTALLMNIAHNAIDKYLKEFDQTIEFPTKLKTEQGSEDVSVGDTNMKIQAATGSGVAYMMLYPAALYCYLWYPNAEGLDQQYSKHQWYLPAMGELLRLLYYVALGTSADAYTGDNGLKTAIFAQAANRAGKSVITFATNNFYWSSTEYSTAYAWRCTLSSSANSNKNDSNWARPIAAYRFVL